MYSKFVVLSKFGGESNMLLVCLVAEVYAPLCMKSELMVVGGDIGETRLYS